MATRSLLDTSILIEVLDYSRHIELLNYYNIISIVSVYEFIRYKKDTLENKLLLEDSFDVIQITNPIVLKAAEIFVKLKENGAKVSENDIYIASTALANNLLLHTKDKDFLEIKKYFKDFKVNFIQE